MRLHSVSAEQVTYAEGFAARFALLVRLRYTTQSQAAAALGVREADVTELKRGEKLPSIPTAISFARELRVPLELLVGEDVTVGDVFDLLRREQPASAASATDR